jgi:hypothetical protein
MEQKKNEQPLQRNFRPSAAVISTKNQTRPMKMKIQFLKIQLSG